MGSRTLQICQPSPPGWASYSQAHHKQDTSKAVPDGCARHPHNSAQALANCPQEKHSREQAGILIATGLRADSRGWKGGSEAKSSGCSPRGLGFKSQHPHGGSQLALTPVPGNHALFLSQQVPEIHADKTPTYIE